MPSTLAWKMSGYWVAEWLPQIDRLVTDGPGRPALAATWATARLWSSRVMAANWCGDNGVGRVAGVGAAIRQLVLAGLPTTSTRTWRRGAGGQGPALSAEDGAVCFQQVPAFHALAPGPRPDQQGDVGVAEGLIRGRNS